MHNILLDILAKKRADVAAAKQSLPLPSLKKQALSRPYTSSFAESIVSVPGTAIIAEIKLASPTHPNLGDASEVPARAKAYQSAGADAISFITEQHYFKGDVQTVPLLKKAVRLPILQKDFVVDEYQLYEARRAGSDAILLIARLVPKSELVRLTALAQKLGLEPVVEINNSPDLAKAIATTTRFIAVNARDLTNFTVDVAQACELLQAIPGNFITLGFSGVHSAEEVGQYAAAGAKGVLVGTALMQAADAGRQLRELRR